MNTKDKLFAILEDSDKMTDIINKACDSQNNVIKESWEVHTARRIELGKRMNDQKLECPECGTRQVQLVGYMDIIPAKWKCRHCKHCFEWEGEEGMSFKVEMKTPLYFSDCTTLLQLGCGRWECECILGYWSVSAPTVEEALREGQHYFIQYFGDGDYNTHLGL